MLCDESIDQNTYDYLYPKEHKIRTPHCYFLPKIHKNYPCRPSLCWKKHSLKLWGPMWKNRRIYRLLLSPPCTKSIYITWKDTKDVVRKIEQLKIPKHCLFVTIDCIGMFTNVLQKEVEQEVLKTLSETNPRIYFPKMPPIRHMEALLKLILHRNCFSFNGKYYLQTTGVAMGKNAPQNFVI